MQPLTELQSRISFVLPMLGTLAVQQTAKQNHMQANNTGLYRYYLKRTLELNDFRHVQLQGYYWFEPYQRLMGQIVNQGCAFRVNARINEMPEVWSNPKGSKGDHSFRLLLSDPALYEAIMQENYCYWQLRDMAKRGVILQDPWWKISYYESPFIQESELLPLGVSYATAQRDLIPQFSTDFQGYTPPAAFARDPLFPSVQWCIYDTLWYPESFSRTAYDAQQGNWVRNRFLRANRKAGYLYEGPIAAVDGYVAADQLNKIDVQPVKEALGLAFHSAHTRTRIIGYQGSNQSELRGVTAKVLGAFHNAASAEDAPISVPMILPVFHEITLIPSTMPYRLSMLTEGPDDLKRFLKWLSYLDEDNLDKATPPAGTEHYWTLLQLLSREDYMKTIYNPDFVGLEKISPREIFEKTYLYPREPYGAGKLQSAYLGFTRTTPVKQEFVENDKNGNPIYRTIKLVKDHVITTVTEVQEESDGALRTYLGSEKNGYRYFLTKNGKILTYEDIACGFARRNPGGGGSFPAGSNMGPPRL